MSSLQVTRLFSNLAFDGNKLAHKPGNILDSTALVAGTTVGAGILALPTFTLPSGILPSTVLLVAVWLYTFVSALLIAEVTLNAMGQLGSSSHGLLAIVENTLGALGARMAGIAYLFLHYALLVAYIAQGGEILLGALEQPWGMHLPAWVGTTTFTLLFGGIIYWGRDRLVERLNNAFFAIVIISFIGLLLLAAAPVNPAQFLFQDWRAIPPAISVMFVALFYNNIIPVITLQLEGDAGKIRTSIFLGSVIPLLIFMAWNAVILGSVSPDLLKSAGEKIVFDPLQSLRNGSAGEWLGFFVSIFSEFAIVTSFIGFVYSLRDFFQEIFPFTPNQSARRLPLMSLILLPPMSVSTINPSIFFTALDYAGALSISVLGSIIPALIAWKQRYQQQRYNLPNQLLVPGGKVTLILMIGVALMVIGQQIL